MNPGSEFNLTSYLAEKRRQVDHGLTRILGSLEKSRELTQAMTHSLMAGGKRLRPILCLAAAEACEKDPACALPAACALEMVHTYSLIHDDLPAMDDDDLRRGVPTCHKQFSEATAVLAGDALLTHAFFVLARPERVFSAFPDPDVRLKVVEILSDAAGVNGMVEGQMRDMQAISPAPDTDQAQALDQLTQIHDRKTGRMIRASLEAGGVSVNAHHQVLAPLLTYADHIGLAFQVMDDILNVEGDPAVMGKAAGSDALNEKLTFPAILGLNESKAYARDLIDQALADLEPFGASGAPLGAIARYIINRNR